MEADSLQPIMAQELASSSRLGFSGDPQVFAARWSADGHRAPGDETRAGFPRQPLKPRRPMRWLEAYVASGKPGCENSGGQCSFSPFCVFPAWR
jgi:hypothetical protein